MPDTSTALAELAAPARHVAAAVAPSVVRIGRDGGRGCGVVLADGAVLTNAHHLRDRTTEVTFADGRAAQGRVLAADPDGDLVVLSVDTGDAPPLLWAEAAVELGTAVFTVTRTTAGGPRVTHGLVSAVDAAFRGPRGRRITGSIEHTAPLPRGSSGSPLVDGDGHLVGITTARLPEGFSAARPTDPALRERVDALLRGESPHRPVLGLALAPAEVAAKLRASVGLPPRDGLLVRAVAEAGPAEAAGVQVGDLVVRAGGAPVAEVDDLHRALDAVAAGGSLALGLVRGTEELEVVATFPA